MQFLDFFSGIGGIRLGLERAGHKCVGWCEFDKFARKSYEAMFNTKGEWTSVDVRTVKPYDVPAADLWTFGFPCQDISIAGKQKGLQKGARSGLFYEIMRLLAGRRQEDKPGWLLIENVKNLLSVGNGFDFARLLLELGQLGYECEWQVLNSKDFGVPQNRERVFVVGHLGGIGQRKVFPIASAGGENPCRMQEITKDVHRAYRLYDTAGLSCTLSAVGGGGGEKTGLYAVPVLTPEREEKRQNGRRMKEPGEPMFTLTAQDRHGVAISGLCTNCRDDFYRGLLEGLSRTLKGNKHDAAVTDGVRIRKLTPRECWRLQGFPDEYFDRAVAAGVSDSQLYKQAGNAVTVNVAEAIGKKLKEVYEDENC